MIQTTNAPPLPTDQLTSQSTGSLSAHEIFSLLLVGSIWGVTNVFLREGSMSSNPDANPCDSSSKEQSFKITSKIHSFWNKIKRIRVWLPYGINQCGSLLFYKCLATSDLSTVVPMCNAIALIVSFLVGRFGFPYLKMREHMDQPIRAFLGIVFILVGVTICMHDRSRTNHDHVDIGS